MRGLFWCLFLCFLLLFGGIANAQIHKLYPFKNNTRVNSINIENCTGADICWLFDELSGAIVDEIGGVSLAVTHTPSYNQTFLGPAGQASPCISYSGANNQQHSIGTNVAALNIGATDDVIYEFDIVIDPSYVSGVKYIFSVNADGSATDYGVLVYLQSTTTGAVFFRADDETEIGIDPVTFPSAIDDGLAHKHEVRLNRGGNLTYELDDVQIASTSAASFNTKTMVNNGIRIGGQYNGGAATLLGSFCFFRAIIDPAAIP